jgi:hypothetical protein
MISEVILKVANREGPALDRANALSAIKLLSALLYQTPKLVFI